MEKGVLKKMNSLLHDCNVMSLATCVDDSPWAASVFFVADDEHNVYFISSDTSRHSTNATSNSRAAATVNTDHDDWLTICGLQIEGHISIVAGERRESILTLYLDKFPSIKSLQATPRNDQEQLIAQRILQSDIYQLQPRTIRLIDNESSFGSKTELQLGS